jgi:hypothetical protein
MRGQAELIDDIYALLFTIPQMIERFWLAEVGLAVALVLILQLRRRRRR